MRKILFAVIPILLLLLLGCSSKTIVVQPAPEQKQTPAVSDSQGSFDMSIENLRQAKIYYARDKFKQAMQHCEAAISADHRNWEAYYYLGLCMQKRKDYARAVETISAGLKYVPDNRLIKAELHTALGYCFENMGRLDDARREYKTALSFNPSNDSARKGNNRVKVEKTLKDWGKEKEINYEG